MRFSRNSANMIGNQECSAKTNDRWPFTHSVPGPQIHDSSLDVEHGLFSPVNSNVNQWAFDRRICSCIQLSRVRSFPDLHLYRNVIGDLTAVMFIILLEVFLRPSNTQELGTQRFKCPFTKEKVIVALGIACLT